MTTPSPEALALKPCPFCSGDAHWSPTYIDQDEPGTVSCANGCGATVIAAGTKAQRIAAWNQRPTPSGEVVQASIPRPPLELEPQVRAVSQRLLTHMRGIARQDGWALGVHGSMARDLDIIAVPWTDDATNADAFVEAMRAAVARELSGQCFIQNIDGKRRVDEKPNGRCAFTLYALSSQLVQSEAGAHPFIDLSIMDFRDHRLAPSGAGESVAWQDGVNYGLQAAFLAARGTNSDLCKSASAAYRNILDCLKNLTAENIPDCYKPSLATPPHLPPAEGDAA